MSDNEIWGGENCKTCICFYTSVIFFQLLTQCNILGFSSNWCRLPGASFFTTGIRGIIIIKFVNIFDDYASWAALLSQQPFCSSCCRTVQLVVFTFFFLEQNSSFAWTGKWQLRHETAKRRTFCEKTSEGTACSSITDTQHVFGWSLHPPDFVTVSKNSKKKR